jgi:hypothetical protein
MTKIFPLLLLLVISCVSDSSTENSTNSGERNFEPVLASNFDVQNLSVLCQALASKEVSLPVLAGNGSTFTFSYALRGCGERVFRPEVEVSAKINRDSNYFFQVLTGGPFLFTDIHNTVFGTFASLCANLNNLMNPIQTGFGQAIWFSTTDSGLCRNDRDNVCVFLEKGSMNESLSYTIISREWLKFSLPQKYRGFAVERQMTTYAGCTDGQTLEARAVLK